MKKNKKLKKSGKQLIYNSLLMLCVVIFLCSAGMLIHKLYQEKKQEDIFYQLADVFSQSEDTTGVKPDSQNKPNSEKNTMEDAYSDEVQESMVEVWEKRLKGYETLKARNSDFVGWIRIDGTMIDYPVMQSLDRSDYYLRRNFEKNQSAYGVPYVSEQCVVGAEGTNLMIYGHHMKNGSMFADLDKYRDAEFYKEHSYIYFDTLEEPSVYQVVGAWLIPNAASATQVEELFQLLFAQNEEEFSSGWNAVQKRLFVNTGIQPQAGVRLLALVTCDYSYNDSRVVVLAQKITE